MTFSPLWAQHMLNGDGNCSVLGFGCKVFERSGCNREHSAVIFVQVALKEKKEAPSQISALNWSGTWTRWLLKVPSNWNSLYYSKYLGFFVVEIHVWLQQCEKNQVNFNSSFLACKMCVVPNAAIIVALSQLKVIWWSWVGPWKVDK